MSIEKFLLARITEDERWPYDYARSHSGPVPSQVSRYLAECQARRGLVGDAMTVPTTSMRRALKWIALPYCEHPDYLPEWAVPRAEYYQRRAAQENR